MYYFFVWREILGFSSLVASCNMTPKAVVFRLFLELYEEKEFVNNVVTAKCI